VRFPVEAPTYAALNPDNLEPGIGVVYSLLGGFVTALSIPGCLETTPDATKKILKDKKAGRPTLFYTLNKTSVLPEEGYER
jgi:hypothetical protein